MGTSILLNRDKQPQNERLRVDLCHFLAEPPLSRDPSDKLEVHLQNV